MKKMTKTSAWVAALAVAGMVSGCSLVNPKSSYTSSANPAQNTSFPGEFNDSGAGSTSVPTADAVVGRIQKGLTLPGSSTSLVNPGSGNFSKVLKAVRTNLPYNSDPSKATGLEQIPLLVYAACSDVNMNSYGINSKGSISSQMTNLVNAGVAMVNQHVGGLAASGQAANQQVSAVFTQLINDDVTSGASLSMTFISVCLAANSFGVGMTGF